jgi:hypothetical protein
MPRGPSIEIYDEEGILFDSFLLNERSNYEKIRNLIGEFLIGYGLIRPEE